MNSPQPAAPPAPLTRRVILRRVAVAFATAVLWAGCSRSPESNPPIVMAPPPEVVTSSLDAALASAISRARQQLVTNLTSSTLWGRLGQALDAADFSAEAQRCYQEALGREADSVRWRHLLALRQLREAPDQALKNLRRAVELSGVTNDASRLRLSQALTERGRLEESTNVLHGLLSVLPQHPAARLELARVSLTRGSVGDLTNLLAPCLTNPYTARPAHLLLAQAWLRSGGAEASARHAQIAATLPKPFDWPDPFLREVQELRRDGRKMAEQVQQFMTERRWPEAEALVNDLLIRFPEDAEGMLLLGRIRLQQRRCDAAEALFRRVLNRQPESPLAWMQLGMSHYCQSQWKPAAVAFEQAVRLKADFGQAHFNLGMARSRLGDSAGAISSLREALRTTPGDPSIHVALAEELHRSGDPSGAGQHLTRALALDPAFPKALKLQERLRAEK